MTLEEYIEEKRKRVANMTLAQARDLIAKTLSHSDMEIEFDKAVWMLLECADEKIEYCNDLTQLSMWQHSHAQKVLELIALRERIDTAITEIENYYSDTVGCQEEMTEERKLIQTGLNLAVEILKRNLEDKEQENGNDD